MNRLITISTIFIILISFSTYGQEHDWKSIDDDYARLIIEQSLNDTTLHNAMRYFYMLDTLDMISTEDQAIDFTELILFNLFGKEAIESQKPYNIGKSENYWLLTGTLPKEMQKGGTFLIVFDSRDCKIIRITHGK